VSDFLKQIAELSPKRLLLLAAQLEERVRTLESELAEQRQRPAHGAIAIVGMGCRFPGGADSPEKFWDLLVNGADAITEVPAWRWSLDELYDPNPHALGKVATRWGGFLDAPEMFDPAFFGIAPIEAVSMDPQQRLLLEVAWEALEDAGIAPAKLNGSNTGVYVGLCNSDYGQIAMNDAPEGLDAYFATGASHSVAAGRISYFLGLRGPSMAIDTACSASLVSVHEACQGLRMRESDLAIAGGVNLVLIPEVTMALSRAQMMSPDGHCKAFSAAANGFVRSEGCGIVVLKRLEDAERDGDRVLAVIRGTAVNQDGRSSGLTAPNGPSQVDVIRAALNDANLPPAAVTLVEAHGTGTSLGDTIEMQAIGEALGNPGGLHSRATALAVGSVKTNFGHTESAAGVAGLIKLVLSIQNKTIPPSLHCLEPNPAIDWAANNTRVPTTPEPWVVSDQQPLRVGAVSSFGFSGTNAHVVVSEVSRATEVASVSRNIPWPVMLSARSKAALLQMAADLSQHLSEHKDLQLADVAYTLATGRSTFNHRAALCAISISHLTEELQLFASGTDDSAVFYAQTSARAPKVAFLFAGQGGERTGMALSLLKSSPVFRSAVAGVDAALAGVITLPIATIFENKKNELSQSTFVQPALFAFQYGLAKFWQSLGVEPALVAGHSMGEIVAATIAGVMSLRDAATLVAARGRLTDQFADPGGMVAVAATRDQALHIISRYSTDVSIAAINGPSSLVISGRGEALEQATQEFELAGIRVKRLNITYGSHSPAMQRVFEPFRVEAEQFAYTAPDIPIVADLTGNLVHDASVFDGSYWTRHLANPVQFASSLHTIRQESVNLCIEMGPRAVLTTFGREASAEAHWIASASGREEDLSALHSAVAEAFVAGASFDGRALFQESHARVVSLPTYPFERERYWPTERSDNPAQQRVSRGQGRGVAALKSVPFTHADGPMEGAVENHSANHWHYQQSWEPQSIKADLTNTRRQWLLLGQEGGTAAMVAQLLSANGADVELLQDLSGINNDQWLSKAVDIVDLRWIEPQVPGETDLSQAENIQSRALELAATSFELWQHAIAASRGLWLFTRGAQPLRTSSSLTGATQAPLWGIARCGTLENPQTLRRIIDLDPTLDSPRQADIIARELLATDEEEQIAYRGEERLAYRIQPAEMLQQLTDEPISIRKDSAYLVTGGLGGLGLALASWLGHRGVAKIVLTTRSASSIAAASQTLNSLRAQGISVETVQVDVTDRDAMRGLLARFGSEPDWPQLRGVFHLAMGTPPASDNPHDHSVDGMNVSNLAIIFAPKVGGTCILRELTQDMPMDFLVAFSTTAAVLGSRHLSHYAAANSFIDAMAHVENAKAPAFFAINWGQWETMRLRSERLKQIYIAGGLIPMEDNAAFDWMGELLKTGLRQTIIANIDWQALAPVYEAKRKRTWLEHVRDFVVAARLTVGGQALLDTGMSIEQLELQIRREAARVLGLRRDALPDPLVALADLGLDSLMAVTLRNRLQVLIGHSLPSTFVFEFPSASQMAVELDLLMWGSDYGSDRSTSTQLQSGSDRKQAQVTNLERDEIRI
jgi:acyl transferase domain-containing protein